MNKEQEKQLKEEIKLLRLSIEKLEKKISFPIYIAPPIYYTEQPTTPQTDPLKPPYVIN